MQATNIPRNANDDLVDPTWPTHYITPSGMPELGQKDLPLQPFYQSAPLVKAYLRFAKLFDGSESTTNMLKQADIVKSENAESGTATLFSPIDI